MAPTMEDRVNPWMRSARLIESDDDRAPIVAKAAKVVEATFFKLSLACSWLLYRLP